MRWCFFGSPAKSSAADEDEDEDQYDNSFINDESEEEEAADDSDYVPETDDGGKEDIKRLQKEAQTFLKRKKWHHFYEHDFYVFYIKILF